MFLYLLWRNELYYNKLFEADIIEIFLAVLLTPFALIVDLIVSPIELLAFIIKKIIERR